MRGIAVNQRRSRAASHCAVPPKCQRLDRSYRACEIHIPRIPGRPCDRRVHRLPSVRRPCRSPHPKHGESPGEPRTVTASCVSAHASATVRTSVTSSDCRYRGRRRRQRHAVPFVITTSATVRRAHCAVHDHYAHPVATLQALEPLGHDGALV